LREVKWVTLGLHASDALRFGVLEAGELAFAIFSRSLSAMVSAEIGLMKSEVERNSKLKSGTSVTGCRSPDLTIGWKRHAII
jgi:hypothetical protein